MKNEEQKYDLLAAQVRGILFTTWDPIGVNQNPRLYDEYDDYIEPLIRLRQSGRPLSLESIQERLAVFEHEAMGIAPHAGAMEQARERTAAAILDLFTRWGQALDCY